ncbi:unnamed protein product [Leptosia nina]|uniref:Uncharacterized protein n=1 Tax=Leptosia nina TaxID=320188 RepID=A0AAV1IWH0_9NEOP
MMLLLFMLGIGSQIIFASCNDSAKDSKDYSCTCIDGYLANRKSRLSVEDAFIEYDIVDDYLPVPPEDFLVASFITAYPDLGNFIPPLRTVDANAISYPKAKPSSEYTLILIDIDAPSKDNRGFVIGMFVNIQGRNLSAINVNNLNINSVVVPFTPPVPALDSGIHRPIALLYEQNGSINPNRLDLLRLSRDRLIPDIEEFTKKYNLKNPVAGNFFVTELSSCSSSDDGRKDE